MEETMRSTQQPEETAIGPFILVCGGYHRGPFKTAEEAAKWADLNISMGAWVIAPLILAQ